MSSLGAGESRPPRAVPVFREVFRTLPRHTSRESAVPVPVGPVSENRARHGAGGREPSAWFPNHVLRFHPRGPAEGLAPQPLFSPASSPLCAWGPAPTGPSGLGWRPRLLLTCVPRWIPSLSLASPPLPLLMPCVLLTLPLQVGSVPSLCALTSVCSCPRLCQCFHSHKIRGIARETDSDQNGSFKKL